VSVRSVSGTPERVHFPLPMGLGDKAMREVPNWGNRRRISRRCVVPCSRSAR